MVLSSVTDAVGRWAAPSGIAVMVVLYVVEFVRGKTNRSELMSMVGLALLLLGSWLSDPLWGLIAVFAGLILAFSAIYQRGRQRRRLAALQPAIAGPTYTLHPVHDLAELNQRTGGAALVRTLREKDLARLPFSVPPAQRWAVRVFRRVGMVQNIAELGPDVWPGYGPRQPTFVPPLELAPLIERVYILSEENVAALMQGLDPGRQTGEFLEINVRTDYPYDGKHYVFGVFLPK